MSSNEPKFQSATHKPSDIKFAVLAIDVVCFRLIDKALWVLLGKVDAHSAFAGKWAVIGGLISPQHTTEESAQSHLKKKAGIRNIYKEQLYTFSEVERDPRGRVVSVAYLALSHKDQRVSGEGEVETKWFPVDALPALAYDHKKIISYALERLRGRIEYTNIAQHLLPEKFTLSELQNVYEVILDKVLDKRNFRKKILSTNLLKDTKTKQKQGIMRPATLYKFASKKVEVVDMV